jgi:archaellum component FlaC
MDGFSMMLSIGSSVLFVGIAWGHTQAQLRSIKERLEEVKDEKASLEKLEGFEERIGDKLETIENRINELREDIQEIKKNP